MLLDISNKISATDSLDSVLKLLIEMATSKLNAERGSIFLNDPDSNELYSRVAMGNFMREIRILNNSGIAGFVFTSGEGVIIPDAMLIRVLIAMYERTGFVTRNILCVPIKSAKNETVAVAQILNKKKGHFTKRDLHLFEVMMKQGALSLQSLQFIEQMEKIRRQELEFINVVSEMTSDIKLGSLLQNVMAEATRMLNAERSTLFLHDEKTNELWSEVGQGLESTQIRFPCHVGIAGAVFQSVGRSIFLMPMLI